jgi:uncharacterized protein (DUF2141 family)
MFKLSPSLVVLAFAVSTGGSAAADEAQASTVSLDVTGLRSNNGTVRCALYSKEDGYPKDPSKAVARGMAAIKDKHAVCEFTNVAPGTYAASFIHDENNNGKLDTNWLGMPKEGYGASNNARGSMGPPKFADARFIYRGGALTLKVTTQY